MKPVKSIAVVLLSGALGTQALASEPQTLPEERRGAVIGGLIGASVGGPIGAGAGAMLGGGLIGKAFGVHRINTELTEELASTEARRARDVSRLQAEVASLDRQLEKARQQVLATRTPSELPIQFRTASSDVEAFYADQVRAIAKMLKQHQDARVTLSGHADRRGPDEYNQTLSESRVAEVKRQLLAAGVPERQIETEAFGESRPVAAEQSFENDFFDRRVVLRVNVDDPSVASSQVSAH